VRRFPRRPPVVGAAGAGAAAGVAGAAELTTEPAVFVTFFAAPVRELNSPARPDDAGAFVEGAGAAAEELEFIYFRSGFRRRLTCGCYELNDSCDCDALSDCGALNGCDELNDSCDCDALSDHQIAKAYTLGGLKLYNY